jgi:predicted metal-dependent hydrolase
VQLRLTWDRARSRRSDAAREIRVGAERVPVAIVRHRGARRYILRVKDDGSLRLTVPRGASIAGGVRFAERQVPWIERERLRQRGRQTPWVSGTPVWFRGEMCALSVAGRAVGFAGIALSLPEPGAPVRPLVEGHLRAFAERELTGRCAALAAEHGLSVTHVRIRNQRSRWGACSGLGVITLNWRLVQMPPGVSDYIICHELAHLRHPNHSRRFWREVERLCPPWRDAEAWIRRFGREIL